MEAPKRPDNEAERINSLHSLGLLDSVPEARYDVITRLAKQIFDVPIALVSLVDAERQWFKSKQGVSVKETSREISFCGHAILQEEIFVVEDAAEDDRFADNPLVIGDPNIRFYAGCPVHAPDGNRIGTLCLIDDKPRTLDARQLQVMQSLRDLVDIEVAVQHSLPVDELTGIPNRRGLNTLGDHSIRLCQRSCIKLTMILVDLDNFKTINDNYGIAVGDQVLRDFTRDLGIIFRESDLIARVGGDEFVVLLPNADALRARTALTRLRGRVDDYNREQKRVKGLDYNYVLVEHDPGVHASINDMLDEAISSLMSLKSEDF